MVCIINTCAMRKKDSSKLARGEIATRLPKARDRGMILFGSVWERQGLGISCLFIKKEIADRTVGNFLYQYR